jgi:murein DD-endopeptidase MepM/ murein hydrolase activator NlpD
MMKRRRDPRQIVVAALVGVMTLVVGASFLAALSPVLAVSSAAPAAVTPCVTAPTLPALPGATATPSDTPSPTPTPSASPSPSPTSSASPSASSSPTPAASPTPTPSASPSPTPAASPSLPALVCPSGSPSLSPTPTASAASPTPSAGGGTSSPGGSGGSGSASGVTTASQTATLRAAQALFSSGSMSAFIASDPGLWGQVRQILSAPLALSPPDLQHFTSVTSKSSQRQHAVAAAAGDRGGPSGPDVASGITIAGGLLASLLVLLRWRRQPRSSPRGIAWILSAVVAVVFGSVAVLELSGLPSASSPTSANAIPAAASASEASATGAVQAAPFTVASRWLHPDPAWSSLTAIENSIAASHDQLAAVETQIASATVQIAQPTSPGAPDPRHRIRPNWRQVLTADIASLVQNHQALAAEYAQQLQAEYSFYISLARSPQQAGAVEVSAASAAPAVQTAVNTDLQAVRTQLSQEAAVAAAQAAGSTGPTSDAASGVAAAALAGSPGAAVSFQAPLSGVGSQPFGPSSFAMELPLVYNGVFYPHFHTGLDIAAPLDSPVGATADGVVVFAGQSRNALGDLVGYGNYVVVKHANGMLSVYGHLDRIEVSTGQIVQRGLVIGLCGSTGWSTGPHVHFELRVNGVPVDPAPYLAVQPPAG